MPLTRYAPRYPGRCRRAHIGAEEEVALLLQLLDVAVGTGPLAHYSPTIRQAQIFALLRQVIVHSSPPPLLLVVEDVHWIDPTSEAWLASVVAGLAQRPMLLLVTYRPGYQPPWLGQSYVDAVGPAVPPVRRRVCAWCRPRRRPPRCQTTCNRRL